MKRRLIKSTRKPKSDHPDSSCGVDYRALREAFYDRVIEVCQERFEQNMEAKKK